MKWLLNILLLTSREDMHQCMEKKKILRKIKLQFQIIKVQPVLPSLTFGNSFQKKAKVSL